MPANIEKYQSEILFLLIGNNPLPNYVAAKFLAKPLGDKPVICLIHSNDTKPYAVNLSEVLGKDNFTFLYGEVEPWDYSNIKREVGKGVEAIKNLAKENSDAVFSVGLNYTGGTKAMSVHAYRAIKELEKDKIQTRFSYLDSDKKLMRIDVEEEEKKVSFDLSEVESAYFEQTKISLVELLQLHGWEKYPHKTENPLTTPRFEEIIHVFCQIIEDKNEWTSWSDFKRNEIAKIIQKCRKDSRYNGTSNKNQKEYEECLRKQVLNIKNIPNSLDTVFQSQLNADNEQLSLANLPNITSAEESCNFLMGTWLEDFVLQKVLLVKDECNLHDVGTSLEIEIPGKKDMKFFELDVVAMRGYQLFAVSCTLDGNVANCKKKLFEVVHRAKQLGGAEAKIGLVSLADSFHKRILEDQLKDDNIKVFGKDDLKELDKKLKNWFNRN